MFKNKKIKVMETEPKSENSITFFFFEPFPKVADDLRLLSTRLLLSKEFSSLANIHIYWRLCALFLNPRTARDVLKLRYFSLNFTRTGWNYWTIFNGATVIN